MIKRFLQLIIVSVALSNVLARPKDDNFPVYKKDEVSKEISSATVDSITEEPFVLTTTENGQNMEKLTIEDIATVARATSGDPSLNPSVAKVTDQLIDTIGQMIEKDARTPPKLKEVLKEKDVKNETTESSPTTTTSGVDKVEANGKFQVTRTDLSGDSSEGKASKKEEVIKGVAVPVIMDEELDIPPKKLQKIPNVNKPLKDEKKRVATTVKPARETLTTTPSSGLSTWILLSDNREATTPTITKKKTASTTTKKPGKNNATTVKPSTVKLVKKTTPKPEKKSEPISALETMVKNQKQTSSPKPALKKKDGSENKENQSESKKVVTIPPAFAIEMTEATGTEISNTEVIPETTTKKKKTSTKKRKKNKNRKKKPVEKSGSDQIIKDIVKKPNQPVGAQFYNFLSREIMPTVGLGLVGVLVTAGLAGLLGYNPFNGGSIPVRRTYESQHGYNPHGNYYNYNSEYSDSEGGGKNEEVLFREVLSGMPEDSRYGMPHADASYPETQLYNSQEQAYDAAKSPTKKEENDDTYSATYGTQYDSYSNKEQVGSKYPVYSGSAYGYDRSTTEKFKASSKYNEEETVEKQPEALYRVSSSYNSDTSSEPEGTNSDTSWHRIGTPMDFSSQASHLEPGPRRLDLEKMTKELTDSEIRKRSKRSPEGILARLVRRSNEVVNVNLEDEKNNEIDVDDVSGSFSNPSTTENIIQDTTVVTSTEQTKSSSSTTEEVKQPNLIDSFPSEPTPTTEVPPSLMDVLRRLAQFKLRLGINFLKATTEAFGKYLEGVQQRVEDSMANDTSFPAMRYAWLGRDAPSWDDDMTKVREKRFQRNAEQTFLLEEDNNDS